MTMFNTYNPLKSNVWGSPVAPAVEPATRKAVVQPPARFLQSTLELERMRLQQVLSAAGKR